MDYFNNDKEVETILREPSIDISITNDFNKIYIYTNMVVENNQESKKDIDNLIKKLEEIKNAME